jgi:hypothetical protein
MRITQSAINTTSSSIRGESQVAYCVLLFSCVISLGLLLNPPRAHADITSNLVGHWTFDEGSGTTANDTSGQGNTGTFGGSPAPTWTSGKIGSGALNFTRNGEYVDMGNTSSLSITTGTVSAWVKTADNNGGYYLVSKVDGSNDRNG